MFNISYVLAGRGCSKKTINSNSSEMHIINTNAVFNISYVLAGRGCSKKTINSNSSEMHIYMSKTYKMQKWDNFAMQNVPSTAI